MSRRLLFLLTVLAGVALGLVAANRPPAPLPPGTEADRVVVDKSGRTLTLLRDGTVLAVYPVSLGAAPVGHPVAKDHVDRDECEVEGAGPKRGVERFPDEDIIWIGVDCA